MDEVEIMATAPILSIDGTWRMNNEDVGVLRVESAGSAIDVTLNLNQAKELREALDTLIEELEELENT